VGRGGQRQLNSEKHQALVSPSEHRLFCCLSQTRGADLSVTLVKWFILKCDISKVIYRVQQDRRDPKLFSDCCLTLNDTFVGLARTVYTHRI
jgi:hypothetical protein